MSQINPLLNFYLNRLIRFGTLKITDASGEDHVWGDGTGDPVHVRLNSKQTERALAFNPALSLGERYMDGEVDMVEGTIFDLLELVFANAGTRAAKEPWMRALGRARHHLRRLVDANTPKHAKRNVKHHYDLSDELYELFLDEDRQYSCAYFENPDMTLEEAQLAKKRHITSKLLFDRPGLKALDIGCGWGGLGLYIAERCEADVTGVTLSEHQHRIANERAAAAGLTDRVRFEIQDYRDREGPYDRIVSVGMFEHVGRDFYRNFFDQCARLLDENGVMLLHTIGHYGEPAETNAFIDKYIFPGGYIPSLSEVVPVIEKSGLIVTDVEILRLHYAETLKAWRERFDARRNEAKALYDERFCRMWEFYLAASEGSFRWQDCVNFQIQIAKKRDALPLTRDYMFEAEAALRRKDEAAAHHPKAQAAE